MPTIDPTAGSAGFKKLYHYEKFNADYLATTLKEQKIHCSNPANLNDPWDCKPWFDCRSMISDPVKLEEVLTFLANAAGPTLATDPRRLLLEDRLRKNPEELRKYIGQFSVGLTAELTKRRIYCLTPIPNSTLMWSHYAANHTGICLEFGVENTLFRKARPVRYCTTYPEWTVHQMEDKVLELVLTKSMDWSYEREFRLIGSHLDGPLKLHGDFFLLPAGALTSVIIGCGSEQAPAIIDIVRNQAPGLTIKRAVRVPDHYKLHIEG
jgi:hypothetical protein